MKIFLKPHHHRNFHRFPKYLLYDNNREAAKLEKQRASHVTSQSLRFFYKWAQCSPTGGDLQMHMMHRRLKLQILSKGSNICYFSKLRFGLLMLNNFIPLLKH